MKTNINSREEMSKNRKLKRAAAQPSEVIRIPQKDNLQLKNIIPLTENQKQTFLSYYHEKNLLLIGSAGTGKSFLSLYLMLQDLLDKDFKYKKLVIIRSVVPSRDMGFLPGNQKEKTKVYELPYQQIFTELFGRGDAYELMQKKGLVEFESTSFLRGLTFNDSLIIVDECQNMTGQEIDTIMTRVGENSRIIFSGDFKQTDLQKEYDKQGLEFFVRIIERMKSFDKIVFKPEDIVRSGLVKEYLLTKENM